MVTLTKTAVTQYDIATNPQAVTNWAVMDAREAEAHVRCAIELGDTIQDYATTDRDGNPLRVVLHICADTEDLGGVYEFAR